MIRELSKNDLILFEILCNEYKKNYFKLYNISNIFSNKNEKIYVFEQEKKLVGFIHIEILYETLSILHIYIKPEYRNKKKASLLIDYVISFSDIENVILEVNTNNILAIKLYEKFGFKVINVRKKYYNDDDAYVMEKKVQNE